MIDVPSLGWGAVHTATPPLTGDVPSTKFEVVLVNVTVPVGPPGAEELTVAVKVTGVPNGELLGFAVTIVVEGQRLTVCVNVPGVAGL